MMTSGNQTPAVQVHVAGGAANADTRADRVSSNSDTLCVDANESHLRPSSPHIPDWLREITHQLKNIRQWRLIIKPDLSLDLEYLSTLVEQAKRKTKAQAVSTQLSLFTPPDADTQQTTSEPTPITPMLTQDTTSKPPSSSAPVNPLAFTVINGTNRQPTGTIILPDEILTIGPDEELHHYLSRVANAAVEAAITSCGTKEAAFIRLGSTPPFESTPPFSLVTRRPTLVLAPGRHT